MPRLTSTAVLADHERALPDANVPTANRTTGSARGRVRLRSAPHDQHLRRRAGLLFLVAAWVLLVPLAAARPVDPSWISGLYDDGDFDNVVTLIGSLVGVSDAPAARATGPDGHASPLPPSRSWHTVSRSLLRLLDRSPPQA